MSRSTVARRRIVSGLVAVLGGLVLTGCGAGAGKGIPVSGKVTFKGQPVAAGKIYFSPAKGNNGAQGVTNIVNGEYDTQKAGRGAPAGANVVRVIGYESAQSTKMTFQFDETMDISAAMTKDFSIPAEAAANVPPPTSGPPP